MVSSDISKQGGDKIAAFEVIVCRERHTDAESRYIYNCHLSLSLSLSLSLNRRLIEIHAIIHLIKCAYRTISSLCLI